MNKEHKYNEAISRFYDTVYERIGDNARDKMYFEEIAEVKGSVLEAGAGTGKIFVPALKNGADIYGIDQSDLMLEKLKCKINESEYHRISIQDIRYFKFDKKFSLIISPFRVFQHLITTDDQLKALGSIYEHLEHGGKYIFDLFVPDLARLQSEEKDLLAFEDEYEPGKYLKLFTSVKPDFIHQTQNVTFKYVWDENGRENISEYSFPMRYFFRYEIENLIARTKFKLENIYGDFNRSDLSNESKQFVVVCSKK